MQSPPSPSSTCMRQRQGEERQEEGGESRNLAEGFETIGQCKEEYGHMGTLCRGKLYKIKEIKESYIKCARNAQAEKLERIKGTV